MPDNIAGEIDNGHGFPGGAVQGAGVDDAETADLFDRRYVAVAEEEIIESGPLVLGPADELCVVAVGDGDLFAGEFQVQKIPAALQAKVPGVSGERGSIEIAVAPDEGAGDSGKEIEDALAAYVAAVDEELGAGGAKGGNPRGRGVGVVVRVA